MEIVAALLQARDAVAGELVPLLADVSRTVVQVHHLVCRQIRVVAAWSEVVPHVGVALGRGWTTR